MAFLYTLYHNSPLSQDDPGGECRQRGAEQEDVAVHWLGRPSAGEPPLHPLQAQLRERQLLDGQRVSNKLALVAKATLEVAGHGH